MTSARKQQIMRNVNRRLQKLNLLNVKYTLNLNEIILCFLLIFSLVKQILSVAQGSWWSLGYYTRVYKELGYHFPYLHVLNIKGMPLALNEPQFNPAALSFYGFLIPNVRQGGKLLSLQRIIVLVYPSRLPQQETDFVCNII